MNEFTIENENIPTLEPENVTSCIRAIAELSLSSIDGVNTVAQTQEEVASKLPEAISDVIKEKPKEGTRASVKAELLRLGLPGISV